MTKHSLNIHNYTFVSFCLKMPFPEKTECGTIVINIYENNTILCMHKNLMNSDTL